MKYYFAYLFARGGIAAAAVWRLFSYTALRRKVVGKLVFFVAPE